MNRRTLFGRFSALQSAYRSADRQDYFRPQLEPLEDRKMLAVDTMLSHNWIDIDESGTGNLNLGDQVQDTVTGLVALYGLSSFGTPEGFGDVTNATDSASPTHHYIVGLENIHDAVQGTKDNGVLQISDGTYAASDVILGGPGHNHPITVFGDNALTVIVPEVASNHSDTSNLGIAGNGSAGAHVAFIINAINTTVSNLTIDGDKGPVSGTGSMNYQQGVATFYDLAQDGNTGANTSTSYTDLTIGNTIQTYTDLTIGNQHSYTDLAVGNDRNYTDLAIGNHRVFTDLVIDANDPTIIYVGTAGAGPQATTGFQPGDVGSLLTITSGTGFTLQTVHITAVATTLSANGKYAATIAPNAGTVGSTNGHGFSDGGSKEVTSASNPFNAASVGSTLKISSSTVLTSYTDLTIGNDHSFTDLTLGNKHTYTDLVIDAANSTFVTSATTPFTAGDINSTLTITSGTGFTPGTYTIMSVAGNIATLSASAGTTGSTGGSGSADGGTKKLTSAAFPFTSGDAGASITITGGTNFTPGVYTIGAVQGNVAVFAVALGTSTAGPSNGTGNFSFTKQVKSAASPFVTSDVGATLSITAGSGFLGGTYTITAVNATTGAATVAASNGNPNPTLGTDGSTNGVGTKQGFTLQSVLITSVAGNVATVSGSLGINDSTGGVGNSFNVKQVTSATTPFAAGDAGSTLTITSTSPWIPATYTIAAVNNGVATLNASAGADGSTNGVGSADGGTSKVSSAAHPFAATDVGKILRVTSGTGFTVQDVTINSVTGVVATVSAALGTDGSTGGNGTTNGGTSNVTSAAHPFQTNQVGLTLTVTAGATITTYNDIVIGNHKTYTDLAIDAVTNTKVTSAGTPFNSGDVGSTLTITSGTGFTPGTYTIASVAGVVATLNNPAGTIGSTGGQATATGGNTKITSAAHPFGAGNYDPATNPNGSVGLTLQVGAHAGFTAGNYTITAVNSGVATLSAAVGTDGATGGVATTEGFILQSAQILAVDPTTHVATFNKAMGDLGSTGGVGSIAAAFYAAYDWVDAETGGSVTAIQIPLDPAPFGPANVTVNMFVSNLTVNNTWVHGIAMSSYFNTAAYKTMGISGCTVNNVGSTSARATDLNNVGILMMNDDNGEVGIDTDDNFPSTTGFGNTVTGAGVGIMTTYYGTPSFGNVGAPDNHTAIVGNTVTNAIQRGFSVTLNHGDNSYGFFEKNTATFSDPNNTATGLYWSHSETFITNDTITGAQTGIKVTNTTFDIQASTGRPVNPLIYAGTLITGPSGSHPNAIGIDFTNTAAEPTAVVGMVGEATITGYATGVKIGQSPIEGGASYSDLVIGPANNQVTSAGSPFGAIDIGNTLTITSGSGFTPGAYLITGVDSGTHVATLAAAVGTVGSTAGHGSTANKPSILVLSGAHIFGNTVGVLAGDNSQVLGGGNFVTDPITTTGTATINPSWNYNQVLGTNTFTIGDQLISSIPVPATADVMNSGNLSLSSTGSFNPLVTGQNAAPVTLFNFNALPKDPADVNVPGGVYPDQAADQPTPVPPATAGPPYETDTWGGTYLGTWHGDMVQDGITHTLVIGGTATDGSGSSFGFGTIGHNDPNNIGYQGLGDAPLRILDPVDLSHTSAVQIVVRPRSDNQSPVFVFGIIDERGNAQAWTFNTPASTTTFTTLTLNMLSPTTNLIGPDSSIDLQHISGFVVGADNGTLTAATNTPFRFEFDNLAFTSIPNSQISVHSSITLGGTLAPTFSAGFTPSVGQSFTLIQNNSGSPVSGSFSNAADGALVNFGGYKWLISYNGNGEHDVIMTRQNDALPVINPVNPAGPYTHTWSGAGAVSVVDPGPGASGATVTDADDTNLASMTISIASPQAHDVLNASNSGNVSVSGNGTATLILTPISGSSALATDFQAVLRTATYNNTQVGEATGTKTINFTAVDPIAGVGTATSTVPISATVSTVASRLVFYQGSAWDKTGTAVRPFTPLPFSDDNAIATDKSAYIAGSGAATFANVISFNQGINGIMVDLTPSSPTHSGMSVATITNDFTFKVGNNNTPNTWPSNTVLPTTVTVRTGAGVGGSDRVELIWPSGSIVEKWLEVNVKSTAAGATHTGLASNDVFFYGDALANSGGGDTAALSETNSTDELGARNNGKTLINNIPISNVFDYNRDGLVNSTDSLLARNNTQTINATKYLNVAGGVFAPTPGGDNGEAAVESALSSSSLSASPASAPAWLVNRLSSIDLNSGPIASFLESLADEDTSESRAILVKADQLADALDLDDSLLDSLVARLEANS